MGETKNEKLKEAFAGLVDGLQDLLEKSDGAKVASIIVRNQPVIKNRSLVVIIVEEGHELPAIITKSEFREFIGLQQEYLFGEFDTTIKETSLDYDA